MFADLIGVSTREQWAELLSARDHSPAVRQHRAGLLARRVRVLAGLFALLVPAWALVDLALLPSVPALRLGLLRLASGAVFLTLLWQCKRDAVPGASILCVSALLYTPAVFYLISQPLLQGFALSGLPRALADIYGLLPLVVIASLSLFPLTLLEFLLPALPVVGLTLYLSYPADPAQIPAAFTQAWSLMLILGISLFSSLSQLRYMIAQVSRASYDALTGAMTRRAGIDALELQFRMGQLQDKPLTLAFLDLDHFKGLNDTYGHDAGDAALRAAAQSLLASVRRGDTVIRWGGEEFILLLPNADCRDAERVLHRLVSRGLGQRPDHTPLTASIGLAELRSDGAGDWQTLVELADGRMYQAKQGGRARAVGCGGLFRSWDTAAPPD